MPNNKNQHYVPQFLLKNFSSDKKSISMCLKESGRILDNGSIRDQCSKPYFYPDQDYEKALGQFEGECHMAIEKVLSNRSQALTQRDFLVLKSFLLLQKVRTLHEVRGFREGIAQVMQYVGSLGPSEDLKTWLDSYDNSEKNVVKMMMANFKDALEITADLRCKVIINKGAGSFITSDDPVIEYNPLLEPFKITNYGLAAIGILLMLPISPKAAIVVFDGGFYKIGSQKQNVIMFNNATDLSWINILTVLHADKAIYYLKGSLTQNDIQGLVIRAKGYGEGEVLKMTPYVAEDGKSEIIHSHSNHFAIGAIFSFLKTLDKARGIRFGNSIGVVDYSRPYCMKVMKYHNDTPPVPHMTFHKKTI